MAHQKAAASKNYSSPSVARKKISGILKRKFLNIMFPQLVYRVAFFLKKEPQEFWGLTIYNDSI